MVPRSSNVSGKARILMVKVISLPSIRLDSTLHISLGAAGDLDRFREWRAGLMMLCPRRVIKGMRAREIRRKLKLHSRWSGGFTFKLVD